MHLKFQKLLAVFSAICITAGSMIMQAPSDRNRASAKTLEEITEEKRQKEAQIEAKKTLLTAIANDLSQKALYQQTLQEEIDLINGKMLLIDSQLQTLNSDIIAKQIEIDALNVEIAEQQIAVEEGLANFKERIRVLYVHGNDSILSALVGATDFYDVLAKLDLIRRISKHDNEMIASLRDEIQELTQNEQDLTANVQALTLKQTEMEVLLDEFHSSRGELDVAMNDNNNAIGMLQATEGDLENELEDSKKQLDDLEEEEDRLILELARKAAEEAARKAAEEAKKTSTTTTTTTTKRTTTTTTTTPKPTTTTTTTTVSTTTVSLAPGQTTKPTTTTTTTTSTTKPTTTTVTTTTTVATTTTTKAPEYKGGVLAWPAPGFYHISSPFGPRWGKTHRGIDISGGGIRGNNACAAASGKVILVKQGCSHDNGSMCGCNSGYGNYVQIDHGNGICTLYAHLLYATVSVGDTVNVGTPIGKIGSTGNSTGPHLHFSVIVNGTFVDPMGYLY